LAVGKRSEGCSKKGGSSSSWSDDVDGSRDDATTTRKRRREEDEKGQLRMGGEGSRKRLAGEEHRDAGLKGDRRHRKTPRKRSIESSNPSAAWQASADEPASRPPAASNPASSLRSRPPSSPSPSARPTQHHYRLPLTPTSALSLEEPTSSCLSLPLPNPSSASAGPRECPSPSRAVCQHTTTRTRRLRTQGPPSVDASHLPRRNPSRVLNGSLRRRRTDCKRSAEGSGRTIRAVGRA
jgi:hypothetical protein